jgi:hypothetical protein
LRKNGRVGRKEGSKADTCRYAELHGDEVENTATLLLVWNIGANFREAKW